MVCNAAPKWGVLLLALMTITSPAFALEEWENGPVHEQDLAEILPAQAMDSAPQDAVPPPVSKPEPSPEELARKRHFGWEWFSLSLGWGSLNDIQAYRSGYPIGAYVLGMKTDVSLFTIRRSTYYWTILELHPTFFIGESGLCSRMGYRMPLGGDLDNELRIGIAVGADYLIASTENYLFGPTLTPHIQYIHNFNWGSVGIGFDAAIHITTKTGPLPEHEDDPDLRLTPFPTRLALYFRWSVF